MIQEPEIVDENSSSIIVQDERNTQVIPKESSAGFLALAPEEMVRYASRVANVLSELIEKQGLSVDLNPRDRNPKKRKYVRVEGWLTLGSLLGILPKEDYVKEHEDGTYEVGISLVRQNDGRMLSSASAICGGDEGNWAGRPKYARRSMAATRATGKAYRMAFGWVMALAGYNPTPAEEMPDPQDHNSGGGSAAAEKIDIPFAPQAGPDIYTGTSYQKQKLKGVFQAQKITDPEKMKKANEIILKAKLGMDDLDAAVQELLHEGTI